MDDGHDATVQTFPPTSEAWRSLNPASVVAGAVILGDQATDNRDDMDDG